jgi:hypothetical protein
VILSSGAKAWPPRSIRARGAAGLLWVLENSKLNLLQFHSQSVYAFSACRRSVEFSGKVSLLIPASPEKAYQAFCFVGFPSQQGRGFCAEDVCLPIKSERNHEEL